jgi:hypothetical protein
MAAFDMAIADTLMIATAYIYCGSCQQRHNVNADIHGLAVSPVCMCPYVSSTADLPNPRDTATHISSVCATPIIWPALVPSPFAHRARVMNTVAIQHAKSSSPSDDLIAKRLYNLIMKHSKVQVIIMHPTTIMAPP